MSYRAAVGFQKTAIYDKCPQGIRTSALENAEPVLSNAANSDIRLSYTLDCPWNGLVGEFLKE